MHKIELNEEQEARRARVGTVQAIAHKIELDKETQARREQAGAASGDRA